MNDRAPEERLSAYRQWCRHVTRAIQDLDLWLAENKQATDETRAAIEAAQAAIQAHRLTVAFVSGDGRGASALIEALFFHEYGRRLLPSGTGAAASCPLEWRWDPARADASLRLLPTETRAQNIPFDRLRADPTVWADHPLDLQDAGKMLARLRDIAQTKSVPRAQAARFGFGPTGPASGMLAEEGPVEIPRWRYAILSLPSSLLRLGLVVLDLPVLDERRRELDLARELLAGAHTIVSVLAVGEADWAADVQLLQHLCHGGQDRLVVALNKIDRLGDEDRGVEMERDLAEGRAAAALGVEPTQIFPVSAQRALTARLSGDKDLLRATGIEALEAHLLARLLGAKREAQLAALDQALGPIVKTHRARIATRLDRVQAQLAELEEYCAKSAAVIAPLLAKTRQDQDVYLSMVQRVQACQEDLLRETRHCREILDHNTIEALIVQARADMARSWTTLGMAGAMQRLFDELRRFMQGIASETDRIRQLVQATYNGFQRDFGFELVPPKVFVLEKFQVESDFLHQEVTAFCRSPGLVLAKQGAVIRRFHEEMVSRARVLFGQLLDTLDRWIREALQPLAEQIEAHKESMERRLDNLQRLGRSKDDAQRRIADTRNAHVELARQLTALRNIHNALREDPGGEPHRQRRPPPMAERA